MCMFVVVRLALQPFSARRRSAQQSARHGRAHHDFIRTVLVRRVRGRRRHRHDRGRRSGGQGAVPKHMDPRGRDYYYYYYYFFFHYYYYY